MQVFTIGYEGTDIERFIRTLLAAEIAVLADVRAVPLSRKKGFSKNVLRDCLEASGIAYLPMTILGDPKPGREAAKAGNYSLFRQIYGAHLKQEELQSALTDLAETAADQRTCLMCFEYKPAECHRSLISDSMKDQGFTVLDLFADDPDRYVRNRHLLFPPTCAIAAE